VIKVGPALAGEPKNKWRRRYKIFSVWAEGEFKRF